MSFFKKYEEWDNEEEVNLLDNKIREEAAVKNKTKNPSVAENESVLYDDVNIVGDIFCEGNMTVYGVVKGNIDCRGDLLVESDMDANIKGDNVTVHASKIKGSLNCSGEIRLDNESEVVGDVVGKGLQLDGKINGNVRIDGLLLIQKSGEIHGDVTVKEIAITKGAILDGRITMLDR